MRSENGLSDLVAHSGQLQGSNRWGPMPQNHLLVTQKLTVHYQEVMNRALKKMNR